MLVQVASEVEFLPALNAPELLELGVDIQVLCEAALVPKFLAALRTHVLVHPRVQIHVLDVISLLDKLLTTFLALVPHDADVDINVADESTLTREMFTTLVTLELLDTVVGVHVSPHVASLSESLATHLAGKLPLPRMYSCVLLQLTGTIEQSVTLPAAEYLDADVGECVLDVFALVLVCLLALLTLEFLSMIHYVVVLCVAVALCVCVCVLVVFWSLSMIQRHSSYILKPISNPLRHI